MNIFLSNYPNRQHLGVSYDILGCFRLSLQKPSPLIQSHVLRLRRLMDAAETRTFERQWFPKEPLRQMEVFAHRIRRSFGFKHGGPGRSFCSFFLTNGILTFSLAPLKMPLTRTPGLHITYIFEVCFTNWFGYKSKQHCQISPVLGVFFGWLL